MRADGSNNGFWVHSRQLVWMNEDTAKSKDLVERRSFDELLAIDVIEPEFTHRQISLLNAQPVPVWKRSLRPRTPPVCSAHSVA